MTISTLFPSKDIFEDDCFIKDADVFHECIDANQI